VKLDAVVTAKKMINLVTVVVSVLEAVVLWVLETVVFSVLEAVVLWVLETVVFWGAVVIY
jgi:hypothetical protein